MISYQMHLMKQPATKVIPPADKFPTNPDGFSPRRPEFEIVGAFAADPIQITSIQSGNGVVLHNVSQLRQRLNII